MHVLGVGPVDGMLRHHGHKDGTIYPDGRVANLWSGGSCSVASAHFPIEEQGRRSNHGHGLIFNSRQKLDWLSDVLTGTTEEGRIRLLCVDQIFTIPVCHFSTVSCKTKPAAATNVLPLETVWPVLGPFDQSSVHNISGQSQWWHLSWKNRANSSEKAPPTALHWALPKPFPRLECCLAPSQRSSAQAICTASCPSSMLSRSLPAKLSQSYFHGFLSVQHAVSLPPSEALRASPIDTARPQENQRLETRHVGAAKQAFRARLPPILTVENLRKG